MYVCGMTVYDFCHIGHARVLVVFDMVRRWIEASGYKLTYVRNITDIDDKIIARAVENGETISALTGRYIQAMQDDAAALGILPPTHEPKATEYVPEMLGIIQELEANGLAYQDPLPNGEAGDVHFSVRGFPSYGRLSGKSLDELRAGERVSVADGKRDPLDFVLWKRAKPSEPEEAIWASAYGPGRPGWHIECSAMSCALLGRHFDIHGGGADLQFPHHENEIAQSEGAMSPVSRSPFVNLWMHNGFVRIDDEKMSKSLGNFFTIREVLERYDPEVLRFFILKAHYRSPLNYSDAALDEARAGLTRLYTALEAAGLDTQSVEARQQATQQALQGASEGASRVGLAFKAAMDDDFNTPEAIAELFGLAAEVNRHVAAKQDKEAKATALLLLGLGSTLGLFGQSAKALKQRGHGPAQLDAQAIEAAIAERVDAKKRKDFALADAIRADLLAKGVALEDGPQGTVWRYL